MHQGYSNGAIFAAAAAYGIFVLALIVVGLVVQWRIASKAGYNGALSLLMLVPLANVVVLVIFAFTEWPLERQLRECRNSGGGSGPGQTLWQPGTVNPPATL